MTLAFFVALADHSYSQQALSALSIPCIRWLDQLQDLLTPFSHIGLDSLARRAEAREHSFVLMELAELSTNSLAEAMSEKLKLPKPVYFVHQLEQDGYRSQIEFHRMI